MSLSGWRNPAYFKHGRWYRRPVSNGAIVTTRSISTCPDGHTVESVLENIGLSACDGTMTSFPGFRPDLADIALTDALLKLQDQKVNLATNFAERRQTAELFRSSLTTIAHSVMEFRRSNPLSIWKKVKKEGFGWKHTPQKWLELQYGWKPLLSDIHGASERIINRSRDGDADRITVTGKSRDSSIHIWEKPFASHARYLMQDRLSWRYNVSLTYAMDNPVVASLSSLGILNPAYLIWEELPFSFVVDWALPVGNWLNAQTASFGWRFMGGCISKKTVMTTVPLSPLISGLPPDQFCSASPGDIGQELDTFEREVYSSSPVPGLHFKNPLSAMHVSEALSLLATAFR